MNLLFGLLYILVHEGTSSILVVIESEAYPRMEEKINDVLRQYLDDDNKLITIRMSQENEEMNLKKVCQLSEVSGVIDLTWSGWPKLRELSLDSDIPYVLLESPLKGVARAVDNILSGLRDATDTVIVMEDAQWTRIGGHFAIPGLGDVMRKAAIAYVSLLEIR